MRTAEEMCEASRSVLRLACDCMPDTRSSDELAAEQKRKFYGKVIGYGYECK